MCDKDKDNYNGEDDYNYQDNITIDDLCYELQCHDLFSTGPRPLHNHTIWIYLCLSYDRNIGNKHSTLS